MPRLDEEEAAARAAQDAAAIGEEPCAWTVVERPVPDLAPHMDVCIESREDWEILETCSGSLAERRAIAGHVVYWHPARVLADVAAKRAILRACCVPDPHDPDDIDGCPECQVLYALAQLYRGREDFDPEWRA